MVVAPSPKSPTRCCPLLAGCNGRLPSHSPSMRWSGRLQQPRVPSVSWSNRLACSAQLGRFRVQCFTFPSHANYRLSLDGETTTNFLLNMRQLTGTLHYVEIVSE